MRTWKRCTFASLILVLVACGIGNAQTTTPPEESKEFLSARPGFYFGAAGTGTELTLDLDDASFFEGLGFEVAPEGSGGELFLGWAFGRGLALETLFTNTLHETGRQDIDANLIRVQLNAIAPILRSGRIQPYLTGGIGGSALYFNGPGIVDTFVSGTMINLGVGVDLHLMPHLALTTAYRYEVFNFKEKTVETPDLSTTVDFRGTATANVWTLGLAFSF